MNKKIFGYIRVSTKEQNEARQIHLMDSQNIDKNDIYIDKATGKNFDRPQYNILKQVLRAKDTLLIASIDRLGRNKQQCLEELRELNKKGIRVMIADIPTSMIKINQKNSAMMEMVNNILIEVYTTMAQEEVEKIDTRRSEGIKAMEIDKITGKRIGKSGRVTGRPKAFDKLSFGNKELIKSWIRKETKLAIVKEETGLSEATLYRIKKEIILV